MKQIPTVANIKPEVKKIRRSVFYIMVTILMLIIGIILYSIINKPPKSEQDAAESQTVSEQTQPKENWYLKESNALPQTIAKTNKQEENTEEPTHQTHAPNLSDPNNQTAPTKTKVQTLQAALESPIKVTRAENQPIKSASADLSETTQLPQSPLPLSNQQMQRLQTMFGEEAGANAQQEKQQFLMAQQQTNPNYLHETIQKPISPYEIKAGTYIPATLSGGINSDLPGQIIAIVNQPVYDSITGNHLLIPQGSKLILTYDANVVYGQQRLLTAVKRILLPNGDSINLEGMPATDQSGYAGFHDEVNNHYLKTFGSAMMMGVITGGFQLSQTPQNSTNNTPTPMSLGISAMGQQMEQVTMGMLNKNLNVQPTLTIKPGYRFNVVVTSDIVLEKPYTL